MPQIYFNYQQSDKTNTPLQNKIKEIPLISIIEQSEHFFTTLSKNALFKPIFSITSYAQKVFKCSKKYFYI